MKLMAVVAAAALLALVPGPMPADAAAGFHASYFSESAFLALSAGQTGQFAVGYANTGDQAWSSSVARASLHTSAPLDNTRDADAGWSVNWPASHLYAHQSTPLVGPGQVGYFVYEVRVPAGAAVGAHTFYGRPAVEGVGLLEDYGYFQVVTVTGPQGAPAVLGAVNADASTVVVTFDRPMVCATDAVGASIATTSNYTFTLSSSGTGVVGAAVVTPNDTCDRASIALVAPLSDGATYKVVVSKVRDVSGAALGPNDNATFVVIARPLVLDLRWSSSTQFTITFSRTMRWPSGNGSPNNTSNYNVNGSGWGAICQPGGQPQVSTDPSARTFSVTCLGSLGVWVGAGTNTMQIRDVADAQGNPLTPNPTTRSF